MTVPEHQARIWHKPWLATLLALLWLSVALDSRASPFLLLASAGALLLWQPLWQADAKPPVRSLLALAAAAALLVLPSHWPAVLWLGLVAGLLAGQAHACHRMRRAQAGALALVLLLWGLHALPAALTVTVPAFASWLSGGVLLACLVLLAGSPSPPPARIQARSVLESAAVLLLLALLSLLTVTLMHETGWPYPAALAAALGGAGLALLGLAALLGGAVSGGLSNLFSRHLLEQGLPLDEWLAWLLDRQALETRPEALLDAALARLLGTPWYAGARWTLDARSQESGSTPGEAWSVRQGGLLLEVWPSPDGLGLHTQTLNLLQVLALVHHFCAARQQEGAQARLKAAHETGARLTHDMKNLLQSLHGLMALAKAPPAEAAPLLAAHLPQLYERIARTLDKLQGGSHLEQTFMPAAQWWQELHARYGARGVAFTGQPRAARGVVRSAMDSVVGVLLENALEKRAAGGPVDVTAAWFEGGDGQGVTVCDSGAAVPDEVAAQLFRLPVESAKGLGLGLYQAARTAYRMGYTLTLEDNVPGRVCFRLRSRLAPAGG
jgi:signal transduction histidine kinase